MMPPMWLYRLCRRFGWGHYCEYDDPTHPDYIGFTAGVCYREGVHLGRRS